MVWGALPSVWRFGFVFGVWGLRFSLHSKHLDQDIGQATIVEEPQAAAETIETKAEENETEGEVGSQGSSELVGGGFTGGPLAYGPGQKKNWQRQRGLGSTLGEVRETTATAPRPQSPCH